MRVVFWNLDKPAGFSIDPTFFPGTWVMRAGSIALLAALLVVLCGAGYYAYQGLTVPGEPMPGNGYIALALGVGFSLIVGCGLMALVFYSSRHGYDEPPHYRNERR
jgi:hypothetical protein